MTPLESGFGFWHPIVWLVSLLVILVFAYILRSFGRGDCKKGTEQTQPFLSGNDEPDTNILHVRASNLYWGYLESLKAYYAPLKKIHTGNIIDYLLWLFGTTFIVFLIGLWQ